MRKLKKMTFFMPRVSVQLFAMKYKLKIVGFNETTNLTLFRVIDVKIDRLCIRFLNSLGRHTRFKLVMKWNLQFQRLVMLVS